MVDSVQTAICYQHVASIFCLKSHAVNSCNTSVHWLRCVIQHVSNIWSNVWPSINIKHSRKLTLLIQVSLSVFVAEVVRNQQFTTVQTWFEGSKYYWFTYINRLLFRDVYFGLFVKLFKTYFTCSFIVHLYNWSVPRLTIYTMIYNYKTRSRYILLFL